MGSQKRRPGEPRSSAVGGQEFWSRGERGVSLTQGSFRPPLPGRKLSGTEGRAPVWEQEHLTVHLCGDWKAVGPSDAPVDPVLSLQWGDGAMGLPSPPLGLLDQCQAIPMGWGPKQLGGGGFLQITHAHLQESVELLFFLPVHISFLKELEVRHKAPTWPNVPGRNGLG